MSYSEQHLRETSEIVSQLDPALCEKAVERRCREAFVRSEKPALMTVSRMRPLGCEQCLVRRGELSI